MLRDLGFRDYHSMEEDFSTEPEDHQDDEKETEGRERVSLNRLLEKHRDVSLTGLLEHRKEEVLFCSDIYQFYTSWYIN
jgi:hypothetical protein